MLSRWFDRQLAAIFYTFFEVLCAVGLRQLAPFVAVVLLIGVLGLALLAVPGCLRSCRRGCFIVAGVAGATQPRGCGNFECLFSFGPTCYPERIALMESHDSTATPAARHQRRLKVAALIAILLVVYALLSEA